MTSLTHIITKKIRNRLCLIPYFSKLGAGNDAIALAELREA
jgi:hypothetical protein